MKNNHPEPACLLSLVAVLGPSGELDCETVCYGHT